MAAKLKPCPFCGSDILSVCNDLDRYVMCDHCGAAVLTPPLLTPSSRHKNLLKGARHDMKVLIACTIKLLHLSPPVELVFFKRTKWPFTPWEDMEVFIANSDTGVRELCWDDDAKEMRVYLYDRIATPTIPSMATKKAIIKYMKDFGFCFSRQEECLLDE